MYKSKTNVDKHVENLLSKLTPKEFKTRAYSIARLYYEVGDYASCQRYVEQYLSIKDNNAAAHKLLGQAFQKLGQKEKALDHFKISLDIDPTQTSLLLDICELLSDDEVTIDPGRAKYWCEKAEATFPRHPVSFHLRERLLKLANPDPKALVNLLKTEIDSRPKDAILHARLLKHYLETNQIKEAFDHSCNVEFGDNNFRNNYAWYETLDEILKHNSLNPQDWLYQLLLLTVRERLCVLSLTETPTGTSKSLIESSELLQHYDQALETVCKARLSTNFVEFHTSLLQHHRGQLVFHAATLLLKKAKKDQISWHDASKFSAPLMLVAWQNIPFDANVSWLKNSPEKIQNVVQRWYIEGAYRCSQAGHYLLFHSQEKSQIFLDQISQACSGSKWKDKIYEKIFSARNDVGKIKSYFMSKELSTPTLRLPRRAEVEAYDSEAQKEYPNSLHHFVWMLLNYKDYANFKCSLFDMLTPKSKNFVNCSPENLDKFDILAFLYCTALSSCQQKTNYSSLYGTEKQILIPANITELLSTLTQVKWWDCAYKFSQNMLGKELTDIRAILSRGIEIVRCVDNHGLHPVILCKLGRIFSNKAKQATYIEEKSNLESRAILYYSSAIPLLEKVKCKLTLKMPEKRMFIYECEDLASTDLKLLMEECKLNVAVHHINENRYENAIEILHNLTSPLAFYHIADVYKKMALEEYQSSDDISIKESTTKYASLLSKAKSYAYKAHDKLKDSETNKNKYLYSDIQFLIEEIETLVGKVDGDVSGLAINDIDGKYSSDEYVSSGGSEPIPNRNNLHVFRNLSSTPFKQQSNMNMTAYRTALDSQVLESTRHDQHHLDRIETQIKNLQKRDTTINDFMEQSKVWFEENRKLGNQIISTINSNIQNTTDQFKLLKISVDHVKDQIDECRNECKDVGELKKQIAELKKEVNKLKKSSSEQNINEAELYNLENEYRSNEQSTFPNQLPFAPPQVMPPFNQRLLPPFAVPSNTFQLYNQNLYNLYNQLSHFTQPQSIPTPAPIFDPARTPVNYPGIYQNPDQMYLDVSHLVPPSMPVAPVAVSTAVPTVPIVSTMASVSTATIASTASTKTVTAAKNWSLPVNVVITSSDPLPTFTSAPAPVLSVTIPQKHIKGTPHNYQITMPSTGETKIQNSPATFTFPAPENKDASNSNENQKSIFKNSFSSNIFNSSRTEVDGSFVIGESPNASVNKSRTLSEKSNSSVDNYDPCPDFKPIIPLPAEVKVRTGEEDETVTFCARAKLFRFDDKQWKERGIGEIKLLQHQTTGKVRVLMRREQVHKICANHIITADMDIKPMKNETKAYFWVANDYADESLMLEKFCVRFKTADIAQEFYQAFEKARKNCDLKSQPIDTTLKAQIPVTDTKESKVTISPTETSKTENQQQSKVVFGGFTFVSTPALKPIADEIKPEVVTPQVTSQSSIFSGLNFKTNATTSFNNIFSTALTKSTESITTADSKVENKMSITKTPADTSNLNNSDTLEEYEPNVEFKPVVALPALVETKTGEEEEIVLFEHRAKLLRFIVASKEWKERGLGNIKLLLHRNNNQKLRLLMRREQVMKVCCNHAVTKDMIFQKMPNLDTAITWCAKDFSEGEFVSETFCLRFKTKQTCDEFLNAIRTAQSKMKDDTKAAKEEQNAAKQNNTSGFGDKFKAKPGSWHCNSCYTNNLENFLKCACCEQPKPCIDDNTVNSSVWGSKFKPKPDSWECKQCLIRNDANVLNCLACKSPREPTLVQTVNTKSLDSGPKFSFGISQPASSNNEVNKVPGLLSSTWGDKFKPKESSWECKQCFVRNDDQVTNCIACYNSKDHSTTNVQNNSITKSTQKFTFGIPSQTLSSVQQNQEQSNAPSQSGWGDKFKPKVGSWECQQCLIRNDANADQCSACNSPKDPDAKKENKSIFDTATNGPKFNFGIPAAPTQTQTSSIFGNSTANKFSFGVSKTQESTVISFGSALSNSPMCGAKTSNIDECLNLTLKKNDLNKPALLPTPQKDSSAFGSQDGGTFDFVFKPKTPPKGKSPMKSPKSDKADESDGNEYASEDEGHHLQFTPVVPLPEKVEVVTGEENEEELFAQRAKLFRFISSEWKERGVGIVKILKHKETGKLRVVMRRDQVLKICLNHALTNDIIYKTKDEKSWLFAANDFSEGELSIENLCLRFKTKEIATEFKQAIDKARDPKSVLTDKKEETSAETDDVIFVSETLATEAEKLKAKKLMLPENFFTYKEREPCQGCRGCTEEDDAIKKENDSSNIPKLETVINKTQSFLTNSNSTPNKSSTPFIQSPSSSIYGTPANFNKSIDTSIFRTPSESMASSKPASQSSFSENKSLFSSPQVVTPTSADVTLTSSNTTPLILAAPKLKTVVVAENKPSTETDSIFGSKNSKPTFGDSKSIFGLTNTSSNSLGLSTNKSIFDNSANNNQEVKTPEVKSIFGSENKPVNIFSTTSSSNIFGLGALNTKSKPATGLFGQALSSTETGSKNVSNSDVEKKDLPLKVDNSLSFAALSSSAPGFGIEKKSDFKWEGAGQQLFGGVQKASNKDESKNVSGAGDQDDTAADEEYDPHYEPIVPLPDMITVTTGEEDEEKLFGERCKLYRFDSNSREWKERGVGELKLLFHPEKNTYRLLLRREQVYKAVLNMLLFTDLELQPMKNSVSAWTWAGVNYAESSAGTQETLAVRFKKQEFANAFKDKVVECVRKLQAAAAKAIREEKEEATKSESDAIKPLRLPKHLTESARADSDLSGNTSETQTSQRKSSTPDTGKQVTFKEDSYNEEEEEAEYGNDYENYEDYEAYYNEEEEESTAYYSCTGSATVDSAAGSTNCPKALLQVQFDQELYSPKILVADHDTGEILADMLIHTETEFQMEGNSCTWSGQDYTNDEPMDKTVTVTFPDSDTAMQFYDSCETSKAATYSSTDPES